LQVAVAYYQIQRGNYNGAAKMFLRMRQWIDPLPDRCRGVDVARLRAEAREAHRALVALGPERLHEFDRSLLRPVHYFVEPQRHEGEKRVENSE
jgi:predicted metal-dependent hydrolase